MQISTNKIVLINQILFILLILNFLFINKANKNTKIDHFSKTFVVGLFNSESLILVPLFNILRIYGSSLFLRISFLKEI